MRKRLNRYIAINQSSSLERVHLVCATSPFKLPCYSKDIPMSRIMSPPAAANMPVVGLVVRNRHFLHIIIALFIISTVGVHGVRVVRRNVHLLHIIVAFFVLVAGLPLTLLHRMLGTIGIVLLF